MLSEESRDAAVASEINPQSWIKTDDIAMSIQKQSKISIVILNWNGADMMRRFLPSVLKHSAEAEVVVADNGRAHRYSKWKK